MVFKYNYILTLIIVCAFQFSCSNKDKNTTNNSDTENNIFPIEFVEDKILEFTKPYTPPMGGPMLKQDTFSIYSITNKSKDTIWIETVPNLESDITNLKDSNIKTLYTYKVSYRKIEDSQWMSVTEGNGRWGSRNDTTRLFPSEKLLFTMGKKGDYLFDSTKFSLIVKLKKDKEWKDSVVTKKLILDKPYFVEDIKTW